MIGRIDMKSWRMNSRILGLVGIFAAFTLLLRILPHAANFSSVFALAIFAGAVLPSFWLGLCLVFFAQGLSDTAIGIDPTWIAVYAALAIQVFIGSQLKSRFNFRTAVVASLAGSVLFFVISNAAVWGLTAMYSKDLIGLKSCFVAAIPFFRNTAMGDMFFTAVFYVCWKLVASPQSAMTRRWQVGALGFSSAQTSDSSGRYK
jgi:hypothetical protein